MYRRLARVRRLDRLEDFRGELRDRFGAPPEAVEWLLRLAELRLLATRWHIAGIHLEGKGLTDPDAPVDVVLVYGHRKRAEKLAARSEGRLRIVDEYSAFFRLRPGEQEPHALYVALKHLLRLPDAPV